MKNLQRLCKYSFQLLILSFFLLSDRAGAVLQLELTQGVDKPIPISISDFSDASTHTSIAAIIRNDLNHCGRFQVTANADNRVIGQVQRIDAQHLRISFSLVNTLQNQPQNLVTQQWMIRTDQQRVLAHRISDIIYQQFLGLRGYFSTRIAYVLVNRTVKNTRYALMVADSDGYQPRSLLSSSQPIVSPAWSHDAKWLAYVSFEKVTPAVYIQALRTGNRQLVSHYHGINGAPAWSPDDHYLALALSRDQANPKIYVLNLINQQLKQITSGSGIDTEPSWSPDGRSLLFTSDRAGSPQIYQVELDSGIVHRISFVGPYNARASFAPNGQSIVMLHRQENGYTIALQDLSTGTVHVLTDSGYEQAPSFSPNGCMILYESDQAYHQGGLRTVATDGRIDLSVPTLQGDVQDPVWSPFLSP